MRIVKKIYKIINSFLQSTKRLNIDAYAACTSFFLILSFMPMLILLCSILPFTRITENDLVTLLQDLLPVMFGSLIEKLVASVYSGGYAVLTVSVIITLWTAGKGISSLIQGLNAVNSIEEKRNYFHKRAICCIYTLIVLALIIISLVLMVFGKVLANYLAGVWEGFEAIQGILIRPRYLYLFLFLTVSFMLLYAFLPNTHQRFRQQLPGAVFSSACWLGFSALFSVYVGRYNPYNMYGNLAMIVVAMVWIYFCLLFFLYGAYINRYFEPINIVLVYPNRKRKAAKEFEKIEAEIRNDEELEMDELRNDQGFLE